MNAIAWLAIFSVLLGLGDGGKILMVVPTPTKSHHNLMERLAIELANKGHEITLITAFRQENPVKNLEEVIYPNYYDNLMKAFRGEKKASPLDLKMSPYTSLLALHAMGLAMTENFLASEAIKKFLRSPRKYELVIGEAFFCEAALAGLSRKYSAPLIALSPSVPSFWVDYMVGNPSPSSYVPSAILGYSERMTFFERLQNFVFDVFSRGYFTTFYLPKQNSLMREHFGDDLPYIADIMHNTSFVLINHHHTLSFPRPYLPNMVEIGGYHVGPVKKLPKDLQEYLDGARNGVILFSMGSHLKSSSMSGEMRDVFLNAFSKLDVDVLWKFEEQLSNLPKNVKIVKWMPQSDILAHPNVRLFITHGGLLSTIEAVKRGVPILGLPVFGDQPMNMLYVERAGFGKTLLIENLSEKLLLDAITEMLNNKTYAANIKKGSALLQDTPMSALDTAIYWVEYVMRHKGASHMRSAAQDLKWYQLYLLDVIGVFLIIIVDCLWISYALLKLVCKRIKTHGQQKSSKEKTN